MALDVSNLASAAIGAAAAIGAGQLANRNAEGRERRVQQAEDRRERLSDLRAIADEVGKALFLLWSAYGPLLRETEPRGFEEPPVQSPVGGRPDPEVWEAAFNNLREAYTRLLLRLEHNHDLVRPVSRAFNLAQNAWNAAVYGYVGGDEESSRMQKLWKGAGETGKAWKEFTRAARQTFGPLDV